MHLYQIGQLTVNMTENNYKLHRTVLKPDCHLSCVFEDNLSF